MKKALFFTSLLLSLALSSQNSGIDATKIAEQYSNSIVKILLFDSLAEKSNPGSGYIGRGSGFIVTEDGIVFTNQHVIDLCVNGYMKYDYYHLDTKETSSHFEGYSKETMEDLAVTKISKVGFPIPIIQVYSAKGNGEFKLYRAKILTMDPSSFDGAILQIVSELDGALPAEKFHPVPIGNSDSTKQGEDLCIYGFPVQYSGDFLTMLSDLSTLTFGKHSGFDFVFNMAYGYIKTDASINGGNSGGPVFNSSNKVIGIASATGNKTGIGLIGGINAMYMVAAPDTALLSKLKRAGLVRPQKSPKINTAIIARTSTDVSVPKQIKKLNKDKRNTRQFLNGTFSIKVIQPVTQGEEFTLNSFTPIFSSDSVATFHCGLVPSLNFEKQFIIWRIKKNLKLLIDWTILSFNPTETKESSVVLFDSTHTDIPNGPPHIHTKPGIGLSFLLGKKVFVNTYYKPDVFFLIGNDEFLRYYSTGPENYLYQIGIYSSTHFASIVGMSLTFNHFNLGIEYKKGDSKVEYQYSLFQYGNPVSKPPDRIFGRYYSNTVYLTLGYSFYKSTLKKLPHY